jgi:hypothetical protein
MNKTPSEAKALLEQIVPAVKDADCEVIACVPYVDLSVAIEATKGTNVKIGAENCHWAESGAFTGEISTGMLKEMGVEYVVLGHSERRQYFGETDETVNKRTKAALAAGLKPSFALASCFGSVSATLLRKLSQDRLSLTYLMFLLRTLRKLLSLMSLFGLSAQAKLLLLSRLKRFAALSVLLLLSSTLRRLQML